MFIIPYNTDAPIYYRPVMTVSLIAVNVVVFVLQIAYPEQMLVNYALWTGSGLHPIQWLTANFLHGGFGHLIGNMFFLWVFGIVVEGKIGHWKMLTVYLGIGVAHEILVQILMLAAEPPVPCLGASGAICGLMMICLIWASENCLNCLLIVLFYIVRIVHFEVSIKVAVGLYLGLQIFILCLTGGQLSTEFLHSMGAVVGLAVGIVMLKTKQVDCEYWDIFSVWRGEHKMSSEERAEREAQKPETVQKRLEQERKHQEKQIRWREQMLEEIRWAVQQGNPLPALAIYQKTQKESPGWTIPEEDMLRLIQLLLKKRHHTESVAAMREYLERYTSKAGPMRLQLAQTLLEMGKSHSAESVLRQLDVNTLDTRQIPFLHKLLKKLKTAEQPETFDTYELADEE
ncbi:MAG: rhomboid family intramembrane serine protease [Planctomycetaceae bacterium]|jgi:membrane associated rhomboid family serine protease|nr:rhomboid family intramembrane serine protease [Planctomycetaceae bacterium]